MTFLLDGFRDDLSWNRSKGRQLKVTFHNSLIGWSMNVQLFSDLSGALVCPWLVFLRTNQFTKLFDHPWRTNRSGSTSAWFSGERWSRFIDAFTDKLNSVQLPVLLWVFRRDRAISQSLLTQCLDCHFIVHENFTHDSSNQSLKYPINNEIFKVLTT